MAKQLMHQFTTNADDLWAAVQVASTRLRMMRPVQVDPTRRQVQFSVSMNLVSWGHNAYVWVEPWPAGSVLQMRASTKFVPSVADIGKVSRLFGELVHAVGVVLLNPPGWRPDPGGAHDLRYFDGNGWTEHVRDGEAASTDPLAIQPASVATSAPANWLPDPTGRHELRYWDGRAWTHHVSDSGLQGTDPLQQP